MQAASRSARRADMRGLRAQRARASARAVPRYDEDADAADADADADATATARSPSFLRPRSSPHAPHRTHCMHRTSRRQHAVADRTNARPTGRPGPFSSLCRCMYRGCWLTAQEGSARGHRRCSCPPTRAAACASQEACASALAAPCPPTAGSPPGLAPDKVAASTTIAATGSSAARTSATGAESSPRACSAGCARSRRRPAQQCRLASEQRRRHWRRAAWSARSRPASAWRCTQ